MNKIKIPKELRSFVDELFTDLLSKPFDLDLAKTLMKEHISKLDPYDAKKVLEQYNDLFSDAINELEESLEKM